MHADHLIPANRQYNPEWRKKYAGTDDIGNLMPSCFSCNNWKHNYQLEDFRKEIEAQIKRLRRDSSAFRLAERFGLLEVNSQTVKFYFERVEEGQ
jgi:5-methylcytosine-specific restriction endonuclease McrA